MKDRFEDFIRQHTDEFDSIEPKDSLWEGIDKKIGKQKTINWRLVISRTAAVAAIFIVSFVVQKMFFNNGFELPRTEAKIEIPELTEAEIYYNNMINVKLSEVQPLLSDHPYLENELNTDLQELDRLYNDLKNDLKDNVANHEVLEAMIQNYRLRIQILEEMMSYLQPEEKEENNANNTRYEL